LADKKTPLPLQFSQGWCDEHYTIYCDRAKINRIIWWYELFPEKSGRSSLTSGASAPGGFCSQILPGISHAGQTGMTQRK